MFPGQGDNYGAPFGPNDGPFTGGGSGGPPPADGIFESIGNEEPADTDGVLDYGDGSDPFLTVGLHFFEKIKAMGK